ncbi:MAG: YceI family protein [Dehalococcoidia bacterium]|nr:YceI family protein [Dehalococcoidia bacterium]
MTTAAAGISTWTIDNAHSSAEFSVKAMMISTVKGRFRTLGGQVQIDEAQPERSSVVATIDASSIDTGVEMRDEHLRSADFFDAPNYAEIAFRSTRVEKVDDARWRVTGELTMRGETREVVLDTEYEGQIRDAYGKQRAAFTATTSIQRKDFGLNWNGVIESGGVLVGDRVRIELRVAAVLEE